MSSPLETEVKRIVHEWQALSEEDAEVQYWLSGAFFALAWLLGGRRFTPSRYIQWVRQCPGYLVILKTLPHEE